MSAPDIVANMARGWSRRPSGVACGTERTGISAALWTGGEGVQEVFAEPDGQRHIVALVQSRFQLELSIDRRPVCRRTVLPGHVQVVRAGERPSAVIWGRHQVLHVYVPHGFIRDLAEEAGARTAELELIDPRYRADPYLAVLARNVLTEMRDGEPLSLLRMDALGQDLAIRLLRAHSNIAGERALLARRNASGLAPWQRKRVEDLLASAGRDVSLAELAASVGLSPYHFARAFKASLGVPPHRYQMTLRVERGKELLATSNQSVTEIAHACGFASSQHMATVFRRFVGTTPTEFRRQAWL